MISSEIYNLNKWKSIEVISNCLNKSIITIPKTSGIYMIYTNTPIYVLKSLSAVRAKGAVDIQSRVVNALKIHSSLLIKRSNKGRYCVYIGHQKNINQRFKEHFNGSIGTGCLSIFRHKTLRNYRWTFYYFEISNINGVVDSNLLRTILENSVKAHFGWPILCAK